MVQSTLKWELNATTEKWMSYAIIGKKKVEC